MWLMMACLLWPRRSAVRFSHTTVLGEKITASIVADLARQILVLDQRLHDIDSQIRDTFGQHPQAGIIESLPGTGPVLGAEFVVAAGDPAAYPDHGKLASAAGLVPVPRDAGRRTGNLHRPQRYSQRLRRLFFLSTQTAVIRPGPNRDYYLRTRAQGLKHVQAVIALAPAASPCGHCCVTTESSPPARRSRKRLDVLIQTPPVTDLSRPAGLWI